jgi:hypothetical protein
MPRPKAALLCASHLRANSGRPPYVARRRLAARGGPERCARCPKQAATETTCGPPSASEQPQFHARLGVPLEHAVQSAAAACHMLWPSAVPRGGDRHKPSQLWRRVARALRPPGARRCGGPVRSNAGYAAPPFTGQEKTRRRRGTLVRKSHFAPCQKEADQRTGRRVDAPCSAIRARAPRSHGYTVCAWRNIGRTPQRVHEEARFGDSSKSLWNLPRRATQQLGARLCC